MITEFEIYLETLGCAKTTIRNYSSDIRNAIKRCIVSEDLSRLNMNRLFNLKVGASTKRRVRASIRKYAKYLVGKGCLEKVPNIIMDIDLPQTQKSIPKITGEDTVKRMIASTDKTEIKLILSIMYSTAARISSVCRLNIEDISDKGILFRMGKGAKPFLSILTEDVRELFIEYIGDKKEGVLFSNNNNKYHSPESLRGKLKRALGSNYNAPHSIRYGRATDLVNKGLDLYSLQTLLNHSNPSTTSKYAQLSSSVLASRIKAVTT